MDASRVIPPAPSAVPGRSGTPASGRRGVRTRLAGALAAGFLLASTPLVLPGAVRSAEAAPPPMVDTTVLSWNLLFARQTHVDGIPDSEMKWSSRAPVQADWIKRENPDVAGFNENELMPNTSVRQATVLQALLPAYTFVHMGTDNVQMFRTSRYTLLGQGETAFTSTRSVVWMKLLDRLTGQRVIHFNTHLAYKQTASREATRTRQVAKLLEVIERANPGRKLPFWVTGDFNTLSPRPDGTVNSTVKALHDGGLSDSTMVGTDTSAVKKVASYGGFGATINGRFAIGALRLTTWRMDYIWVNKGMAVKSWRIGVGPDHTTKTVNGRNNVPVYGASVIPSDHNQVLAVIPLVVLDDGPGPSPTVSPTIKPTSTATAKPSAPPTATPSSTAKPTASSTPTATRTPAPEPTATRRPGSTATSTNTPTVRPTATATRRSTSTLTASPTASSRSTATTTPTASPSPSASSTDEPRKTIAFGIAGPPTSGGLAGGGAPGDTGLIAGGLALVLGAAGGAVFLVRNGAFRGAA